MRRAIWPIVILGFLGCTREEVFKELRFAMNTYVQIKVWGAPEDSLSKAVDAAFAEIRRIDSLTSVFSTKSAVWLLNEQGYIASEELSNLMQLALDVSDKSRGAFDPTVYPLLKLWGFYDSTECNRKVPSGEAIEEVLKFVDYTAIEIKADTVNLDSKYAEGSLQVFRTFWVDLSGIAKGYAVDRAVHVLAEQGIEKGIVDAGGDIFCLGKRREGWFAETFVKNKTKWSIGIRHPRRDNPNETIGIIRVNQCAVATSGDYENFFDADGVRYHHLMDPATGMPAHGVISATVIAPTTRQADAWTTALFVMGEKGIRLLDSLEGLEGLIIMEDEAILTTKNFPELKER